MALPLGRRAPLVDVQLLLGIRWNDSGDIEGCLGSPLGGQGWWVAQALAGLGTDHLSRVCVLAVDAEGLAVCPRGRPLNRLSEGKRAGNPLSQSSQEASPTDWGGTGLVAPRCWLCAAMPCAQLCCGSRKEWWLGSLWPAWRQQAGQRKRRAGPLQRSCLSQPRALQRCRSQPGVQEGVPEEELWRGEPSTGVRHCARCGVPHGR
jgi:hypothetical protein